jgi:hypothetical protein
MLETLLIISATFPLPLIPSHEGRGDFEDFLKGPFSLLGCKNIYALPFERY